MKKILLILVSFIFIGACAQTTALVGPAIMVGSTGNVMQAGLSYGSNIVVKEATGKSPGEHVSTYVVSEQEKRKSKKIQEEMVSYLESHINSMRSKLSIKN